MKLAILQARMGSSRLPNKVLKEIKDKTILEHCIDRIKRSIYIDMLVVATTTDVKDDIIVNLCQKLNVEVFRGSEQDCLDRYYKCALNYNADIIIRLTSDCPLIDPSIIDNVIYYFQNNTCKYLKNTWYPEPLYGYPSGFDVEIFTFNSLKQHWKSETDPFKREHVMSSFNPKTYYPINIPKYISELHLSVDTQNDFDLINYIITNLSDTFTFDDVIAIV